MPPIILTDREQADLAEAERCVDVAIGSSDEAQFEDSMNRAYELLKPIVSKQVPHAQYLYACYMLSRESAGEAEIERRRIDLIRAAAEAGHAQAQFAYGQMYDSGGELGHDAVESARWFRLSAEQGYAYAQWVHGLNLLSGQGVPQDEDLGLSFIRRAADGKFEGALEFLADAYESGSYGFPIDQSQADMLRSRKVDPDAIRF